MRVFLTWRLVFGQDYVAFLENDAWYHMRLVDALVRDFPWRIWHDPYLLHPGGGPVNAGPVLDWIVAGVALVLGFGSPSPRLVDVVGAYVPPVLGALTVVPVYVLGRVLFSRNAGLWAGVMVAVMPGQLLRRSLLGFTDHHCAEVFLSTTAVMFIVLALTCRATASRRRAFALAAGVALGGYLLTWSGGTLFVAIFVVWAVLQLLVDAVRGSESDDVVGVVLAVLPVAAVMVTPWAATRPYFTYQLIALVGGAVVIWVFQFGRRMGRRSTWSRATWATAAVGVVCLAATLAVIVLGESVASLVSDVSRVSPFRPRGFVAEAQPLMASELWRPIPLWEEFTFSLVLAVAGTGVLLVKGVGGKRSPQLTLLALWTATMVFATFGQVRFAYYLAVNVALIGGFAADRVLAAVGLVGARTAIRTLATCVMGCLVVVPGVPLLRPILNAAADPNQNWYDAMSWLSTNTPEPFSNSAAYYRAGPPGSAKSDYGVLAVWDYGYWITRIARRVPVSNPRQSGVQDVAAFLLASNESDANAVIERVGGRYVVVDLQLQGPSTSTMFPKHFNGILVAAGRVMQDYCGLFSEQDASTGKPGKPVVYCYPEYYRTMAMRLYLYGGRAVTPASVVVLTTRREVRDGIALNVVTGERRFNTHDEASRFVTSSGRSDLKIVSKHPHLTCVPLEALTSYKAVFNSFDREVTSHSAPSLVQIFEYQPHRR